MFSIPKKIKQARVLARVAAILLGLLFCSMAAQGELLKDAAKIKEPPDPLEFDTDTLYDDVEAGVDAENIQGFVSGECLVYIELVGVPIPIPLLVNHITMHVPDLLVTAANQPFSYLWKDELKVPQEELFKLIHGFMYGLVSPTPTSGGVLHTKGGGISRTRHKDVEIYGNPWIAPPSVKPKIKDFAFKGFKIKSKKGFYSLAKEKFPLMQFGCITYFPPYGHIFNSEIDFFWRIDIPYLNQILSLVPRTVGPGWIPIAGGLIPGQEVLSSLFPLKGTVTNPIHAHGALVTALRAAYISTSSPFPPDFALFTLHPSQWLPSYFQSCISHECQTFTSEESKWGKDKAGTWQLVSPKADIMFPPLHALALPLDSETYIDYLALVDDAVPPGEAGRAGPAPAGGNLSVPGSGPSKLTNPGEKYSFLNWRCHKCCDIPKGIPGVVSVETIYVAIFDEGCETYIPNYHVPVFESILQQKKAEYLKKLKEGGG